MIDDTRGPSNAVDAANSTGGTEARIAFCQECGRALTISNVCRVGNGVFCVPCSLQRETPGAWSPGNGNAYPGSGLPSAASMSTGDPKPGIAGCLGFIPGVGAMYNGQYAKGAMHLIVFVVLVTLADNVNWVFYWLVWGWVFYQAFDAYHTARARRDGLPLPNPFGWNDLGERLGLQRTSPPETVSSKPNGSTYRGADANWASYVQPEKPARSADTPPAEPLNDNPYAGTHPEPGPRPVPRSPVPPPYVPYTPTYTASAPGMTAVSLPPPPGRARHFPMGAVWLIGLGIVFLTGNLSPEWRLSGLWLVSVLLAALAAWGALRRWDEFRTGQLSASRPQSLAGVMVGPVMLLSVAVLLALQAGHALSVHRSWPVLLVVWGGMLLLQRTAPHSLPIDRIDVPEVVSQPMRSTSGTGSLGL